MEQIQTSKSCYLPPTLIYWEDLKHIEEIFKSKGHTNIKVTSGKYRYNSLEEIREESKDGFLKQLSVSGD